MDSTRVIILVGLLYHVEVRRTYMQSVGMHQTLFGTERSAALTMEQSIKIYIDKDINVNPKAIEQELIRQYYMIPQGDSSWSDEYMSYLNAVIDDDVDKTYSSALCDGVLREMLKATKLTTFQERLASLQALNKINKVQEVVQEFAVDFNKINQNARPVYDIIGDVKSLLQHEERIPTGISFLDRVFCGGIVPGKHVGILGPTGGGKSIIATQFNTNMAFRNIGTCLLQAEQPISNDITQRYLTQLVGCDISEFRFKSYAELSDDIKERLEKLRHLTGLMKAVSYAVTDDDGKEYPFHGVVDLKDDIKRVQDELGDKLKFLVIDWLGRFIMQAMSTQNISGNDSRSFQLMASDFMAELNAFSRTLGLTNIYFHQLSNEAKSKGSAHKPAALEADQFRSFANTLEYVAQLGVACRVDPKVPVAWFGADKVRDGIPGQWCVVRINGERMRLEETLEGEYIVGSGGLLIRADAVMYDNAPVDEGSMYIANQGSVEAMTGGYI